MRDSFLCATVGLGEMTTNVSGGFNPAQSVAGFCCSGVDLIVQTVSNGEWAFLMAMGTVIQKVSSFIQWLTTFVFIRMSLTYTVLETLFWTLLDAPTWRKSSRRYR